MPDESHADAMLRETRDAVLRLTRVVVGDGMEIGLAEQVRRNAEQVRRLRVDMTELTNSVDKHLRGQPQESARMFWLKVAGLVALIGIVLEGLRWITGIGG